MMMTLYCGFSLGKHKLDFLSKGSKKIATFVYNQTYITL